MSRLDCILEAISNDAKHPTTAIRRELERTRKKAVGCMLEFCPEELIYAAGMLPVGLWGGNVELSLVKRYFPAFFCAPVQQNLELALQGAFDGLLTAVIVPILCDTLKSASQNWRIAVPQIPMIPVTYPQNRKSRSGQAFLRCELEDALKKLEQINRCKVSEQDVTNAILLYNRYRQTMREFAERAAHHTDIITPAVRHSVFQAGFYRDKADYLRTVQELTAQLELFPQTKGRHPIALTGIALDVPRVLEAMEQNGLSVAADTLAQEYGQAAFPVPDGDDGLTRLAAWWGQVRCSSLAADPRKERVEYMIRLVREGWAQGVIVSAPSFCDPEEYDEPIFHSAFQAAGIPHLYLELNDAPSAEQAAARVQGFAEMLP